MSGISNVVTRSQSSPRLIQTAPAGRLRRARGAGASLLTMRMKAGSRGVLPAQARLSTITIPSGLHSFLVEAVKEIMQILQPLQLLAKEEKGRTHKLN